MRRSGEKRSKIEPRCTDQQATSPWTVGEERAITAAGERVDVTARDQRAGAVDDDLGHAADPVAEHRLEA